MRSCAAIDLHSNNNVVAILDEQDRIRFEERLPNNLAASWNEWRRIGRTCRRVSDEPEVSSVGTPDAVDGIRVRAVD